MRYLLILVWAIVSAIIIIDGGAHELLVWIGRFIAIVGGVYLCARLASAAFFTSKRHYDERKKP